MISLFNGVSFTWKSASGALAYDGEGWPWEKPLKWLGLVDPRLMVNTMKTITLEPREGNFRWWNPLRCIVVRPTWVANAFGLTNPGLDWWMKCVAPKIDRDRNEIIGSIYGTLTDLAAMALAMNDVDLVGLEVNVSCPNTKDDVLVNRQKVVQAAELVKKASRHPVGVKLSVTHDIDYILPRIAGMADWIDINSVPWSIAFPNRKSPLAKFGGGGVSGKIVQDITWPFAKRIMDMCDIPVVAPSVWWYSDIAKLQVMGFHAFSFGSVFLPHPLRPKRIIKRCERENV